ncbi:MAG: glutaredoxin family protein [Halioglobus sp.]
MTTFKLYGTSACHLCEVAEMLVQQQLRQDSHVRVELQDISDSDELVDRLGTRIPVLAHPDGRELGWPFSAADISAFLYG